MRDCAIAIAAIDYCQRCLPLLYWLSVADSDACHACRFQIGCCRLWPLRHAAAMPFRHEFRHY
jgi:hypothetical protein